MDLADELYDLVTRLYPICRSITGDGVRRTLAIIGEHVPLQVHEVPSGTKVLDWEVPDEWNIADAYIADDAGRRLVDLGACNLHVLNYSVPVDDELSLEELRPHLFSLPDQPDRVPYRTSYYDRNWGFCLADRQLRAMADQRYRVRIDSTLRPGYLTYGEVVVPGRTDDEILVSSHVCHPSLCDDNLSGIAVSAALARRLLDGPQLRHTVRFVYAPGTIGAITWLARNRETAGRIRHGLTLTCLGDDHPFTYKRTVGADATIDRAAAHVLARDSPDNQLIDFFPYGYDERQYNAPGFRLPVGSLMRGRHGQFPEYHTSGDDLSFVTGARMAHSLEVLGAIVGVVDGDRRMLNTEPFGEPQLGRRGLYGAVGGQQLPDGQLAMLWVLNLSRRGPLAARHRRARRAAVRDDPGDRRHARGARAAHRARWLNGDPLPSLPRQPRPTSQRPFCTASGLEEELLGLVGEEHLQLLTQLRVGPQRRIGVDDGERRLPRQLHQLPVAPQRRQLQVVATGLGGVHDRALAPQFEVDLGQFEPVGRGHQRLYPGVAAIGRTRRVLCLRPRGDEPARRRDGPPPHPAPQLVELGDAEAVGVEHDHDRRVRARRRRPR